MACRRWLCKAGAVPPVRLAAHVGSTRPCATQAPAPVQSSLSPVLIGALAGGIAGAVATFGLLSATRTDQWTEIRQRMPTRIILVRHGESEGNADHTLYRSKGDNAIELTERGSEQARAVGKRIKQLIGDDSVAMFVSPFQRTVQTARNLRQAIDDQIEVTHITPQIREQEFGNLQGENFKQLREEQDKVGRFFYRFPTGESGCDVYDRVKVWWDRLMWINERPGIAPIDCVVVVTHGLTMRLILMQLNMWSPDTFHSVWNAGNCDMYVLHKSLEKTGFSPYELDATEGDSPTSSKKIIVELTSGEKKDVVLKDYLSIPSPRTRQFDIIARMLKEQHGIDPKTITHSCGRHCDGVGIDCFAGRYKKYF